jgi:hypothetical protein
MRGVQRKLPLSAASAPFARSKEIALTPSSRLPTLSLNKAMLEQARCRAVRPLGSRRLTWAPTASRYRIMSG